MVNLDYWRRDGEGACKPISNDSSSGFNLNNPKSPVYSSE